MPPSFPPASSRPAEPTRLPTVGSLLRDALVIEDVNRVLAQGDAAAVDALLIRPDLQKVTIGAAHWAGFFRWGSEAAFATAMALRDSDTLGDSNLFDALLRPTPDAVARTVVWCGAVAQLMSNDAEALFAEAARRAVDGRAWPQAQQILGHLWLDRTQLVFLVACAAERDVPPAVLETLVSRSGTGQPVHWGIAADVLVEREDWARLAPLVPHCSTEGALFALERLLGKGRHDLSQRWLELLSPERRDDVWNRLRAEAESQAQPEANPTEADWRVLDGVGVLMADDEREAWSRPWAGHLPLTEQRILAHQRAAQAAQALDPRPVHPRRRS